MLLSRFEDYRRFGTVFQLDEGDRQVQYFVPEETMTSAPSLWVARANIAVQLCLAWKNKYGETIIPHVPDKEGEPITFHWDHPDWIDGEIVEERREIDAPRKAIERG